VVLEKTKRFIHLPNRYLLETGIEFEFGPQRIRDLVFVCPKFVGGVKKSGKMVTSFMDGPIGDNSLQARGGLYFIVWQLCGDIHNLFFSRLL
jgi:hypothetical protein